MSVRIHKLILVHGFGGILVNSQGFPGCNSVSIHFDMYTGWTNLDKLLNMHDLGFLENGLGITASAAEKA